eukprot:TRINITY_DN11765_c0_g1_i1.p1 TRINITY_DN11765_c0_g1~~TRINITY_DN11765_c0_g1_i1.p1  ORF type:complete len:260 (+),score=-19.11 TRINITY_DN11765_c0_g1_i1:693-1472(+)
MHAFTIKQKRFLKHTLKKNQGKKRTKCYYQQILYTLLLQIICANIFCKHKMYHFSIDDNYVIKNTRLSVHAKSVTQLNQSPISIFYLSSFLRRMKNLNRNEHVETINRVYYNRRNITYIRSSQETQLPVRNKLDFQSSLELMVTFYTKSLRNTLRLVFRKIILTVSISANIRMRKQSQVVGYINHSTQYLYFFKICYTESTSTKIQIYVIVMFRYSPHDSQNYEDKKRTCQYYKYVYRPLRRQGSNYMQFKILWMILLY